MNDNTVLRIKVPAHLYESVKEQLTLSEAKKGKHNLGAGMEIVKEKKMKTPKDGMKKVEETQEMDEALVSKVADFFKKVGDNLAKGLGTACVRKYNEAIKSGKTEDEAMAIYNGCLASEEGGKQGAVVSKTTGIAEKKERTMDELKKAKDMLEMKIKKMEESLNEKKDDEGAAE